MDFMKRVYGNGGMVEILIMVIIEIYVHEKGGTSGWPV